VTYSINVAQYQTEATNIVAQMQSAGVTTVLCYCDPVVPIFLGNAAQSQQYKPEWVQPYWGDAQARQVANGNWQGVMASGPQWPADNENEAYRVYKMASGGQAPHTNAYAAAYVALLQVYMGLQAAGPTLTPQNLMRGYQSLPPTGEGAVGTWTFNGSHAFTPPSSAPVSWFDPSYKSNFDGANGGYRSCDAGKFYPFEQMSAWGGPRQQMHCFGK
jgi:ABC-type branched-subunit amino acid transport system substrate-binding protein